MHQKAVSSLTDPHPITPTSHDIAWLMKNRLVLHTAPPQGEEVIDWMHRSLQQILDFLSHHRIQIATVLLRDPEFQKKARAWSEYYSQTFSTVLGNSLSRGLMTEGIFGLVFDLWATQMKRDGHYPVHRLPAEHAQFDDLPFFDDHVRLTKSLRGLGVLCVPQATCGEHRGENVEYDVVASIGKKLLFMDVTSDGDRVSSKSQANEAQKKVLALAGSEACKAEHVVIYLADIPHPQREENIGSR